MADLTIAADTNEQIERNIYEGVEVAQGCTVHYKPRKLWVFDFCVWGDWEETKGKTVIPNYAVEFKGGGDLISSLMNGENYGRELKKIDKAKQLWGNEGRGVIYVADVDMEGIRAYDYTRFKRKSVSYHSVMSKISEMRYRHGVQVVLCSNAVQAQYTVVRLLRARFKEVSFKNKTRGTK